MIWTYSEAARAIQEHLVARVFETTRANDSLIVQSMPIGIGFEGDRHAVLREDGTETNREFQVMQGTATLATPPDEVVTLRAAEACFTELGRSLSVEKAKGIFRTLDADLAAAGRPMTTAAATPDGLMDTLEGMPMDFHPDGQPQWPMLTGGQEVVEKLRAAWETLKSTPEHVRRLENILRKKRDEWTTRENHKHLVD